MKTIEYLELKELTRGFVKSLIEYDNINVDYDENTLTLHINKLYDWEYKENKYEKNN